MKVMPIALVVLFFGVLNAGAHVYSGRGAEKGKQIDSSGHLASTVLEIKARALDYMEGWFEGSVERMERCLHPDLAKRGLYRIRETGRDRFEFHSRATLIEGTRIGRGKQFNPEKRNIQVTVLDVDGNLASVKVSCMLTVEYLHLARYDGRWLVVNVIWERRLS